MIIACPDFRDSHFLPIPYETTYKYVNVKYFMPKNSQCDGKSSRWHLIGSEFDWAIAEWSVVADALVMRDQGSMIFLTGNSGTATS
jgi:hypothetical protein